MADQSAFFLYEGGVIPEERKSGITRVRIGQNITEISEGAFFAFGNLNEGLQIGPPGLFRSCAALKLANLVEVHFNEGLQVIGACLGGVYVNCTPANNRNLFYQCWILSFPGMLIWVLQSCCLPVEKTAPFTTGTAMVESVELPSLLLLLVAR